MTQPSYLMESDTEAGRLEGKTDARFTQQLLRLVGLKKGHRALDAGAGTGAVAREMARIVGPSGRALALDLSPERLRHGQELSGGGAARAQFVAGDLYRIPIRSESFDLVWCRFVFEYLDRPEKVFAELARLVTPGGKLVLGDLDGNGLFHHPLPTALRLSLERLVAGLAGRFDPNAGRKLFSHFKRAGFSDIRVHLFPYNLYAGTAPRSALENWSTKFRTLRPVGIPLLGGAARYDGFVRRFLTLLKDDGTFNYSVLLMVEGVR